MAAPVRDLDCVHRTASFTCCQSQKTLYEPPELSRYGRSKFGAVRRRWRRRRDEALGADRAVWAGFADFERTLPQKVGKWGRWGGATLTSGRSGGIVGVVISRNLASVTVTLARGNDRYGRSTAPAPAPRGIFSSCAMNTCAQSQRSLQTDFVARNYEQNTPAAVFGGRSHEDEKTIGGLAADGLASCPGHSRSSHRAGRWMEELRAHKSF